jgi:hypothetical protein
MVESMEQQLTDANTVLGTNLVGGRGLAALSLAMICCGFTRLDGLTFEQSLRLKAALPMPLPPETRVDMPIQELGRAYYNKQSLPVLAPVPVQA